MWDLFDFNRDGTVDPGEEALGFLIQNECVNGQETEEKNGAEDDEENGES